MESALFMHSPMQCERISHRKDAAKAAQGRAVSRGEEHSLFDWIVAVS